MPRRRVIQLSPNAPQHKETRMREAIESISSGYCRGSAEAARLFNIPQSTLWRRLKNNVMKQRGGNGKKLDIEQDIAVCNWLDRCLRHGFPPRLDHIQHVAQRVLNSCRDPTTPAIPLGLHWTRRFIDRHPEYALRLSKPLDVRRHAQHNAPEILAWYREFKAVLLELGCWRRIFGTWMNQVSLPAW